MTQHAIQAELAKSAASWDLRHPGVIMQGSNGEEIHEFKGTWPLNAVWAGRLIGVVIGAVGAMLAAVGFWLTLVGGSLFYLVSGIGYVVVGVVGSMRIMRDLHAGMAPATVTNGAAHHTIEHPRSIL